MSDRKGLPNPDQGDLVRVHFLGAARGVTGSQFLVETPHLRVLIDCGMFQGSRAEERLNDLPFAFRPKDIDAVLLTHAHLDHCGRLPLLAQRGFRGPIHCTEPTVDLAAIIMRDSARIQEGDAERENRRRRRRGRSPIKPLYDSGDAEKGVGLLEGHEFNQRIELGKGVSYCFRYAGHILGAASIEIYVEHGGVTRKLLFSGDLGRDDMPLMPLPETNTGADLVCIESTYGDRRHPPMHDTLERFRELIRGAEQRHGNILIPVFAIGRSQAILAHLAEMEHEEHHSLGRVYLDTPMGIDVTELYKKHKRHLKPHALEPYGGKLPLPREMFFTRLPEQSMRINSERNGIILSASGMLDAGRIQHHLKHNLWRQEAQLVIVGYQARGSLGRRLIEGAKRVKIMGDEIAVKASIETLNGFSAHGDGEDLMAWMAEFEAQPEKLCLIHGEYDNQQRFAQAIDERFGWRAEIPGPGDVVELGLTGAPAKVGV